MSNSFCIAMFYIITSVTATFYLQLVFTMGHPLQIIGIKKVTGNLNFL